MTESQGHHEEQGEPRSEQRAAPNSGDPEPDSDQGPTGGEDRGGANDASDESEFVRRGNGRDTQSRQDRTGQQQRSQRGAGKDRRGDRSSERGGSPSRGKGGDNRGGRSRQGDGGSSLDRRGAGRTRGSENRRSPEGRRGQKQGRQQGSPPSGGAASGGQPPSANASGGSRRPAPGRAASDERKPAEPQGPPIPEEITGEELDREVRAQLRSLPRTAHEQVARHLVAAGQLLEEDPDLALAHAEAARSAGGRLAVVREACGVAAYMAGNYEKTLAELRAARRISGSAAYLPMMADAERGLGRPERALEFWGSEEAGVLEEASLMELRIVVAGARQDLGQPDAAVQLLNVPELRPSEIEPWTVRIRYAYAAALLSAGRHDDAVEWFALADQADVEGETDAGLRYAELITG